MTKPIRPDEINQLKTHNFPPEVIEVINKLIVENWNGEVAIIFQNDIVNALSARLGIGYNEVYSRNLLSFETIETAYERAGWQVEYDRPGFNESYPAAFTFERRKRS